MDSPGFPNICSGKILSFICKEGATHGSQAGQTGQICCEEEDGRGTGQEAAAGTGAGERSRAAQWSGAWPLGRHCLAAESQLCHLLAV